MPPDPRILTVRSLKGGSLAQIVLAFLSARKALDLEEIIIWTGLNQETARDNLKTLKDMGFIDKQILAHNRQVWLPGGDLLPIFQQFQIAGSPRTGDESYFQIAGSPRSEKQDSNINSSPFIQLIEEEDSLKLMESSSSTLSDQFAETPRTDKNAQAIQKLLENLRLAFDPEFYGVLEIRPEFLACGYYDVLGWIAKAYHDREALTRGGGPIGLIAARLAALKPTNPYYLEKYIYILPESYLEAVGEIAYECPYCQDLFPTRDNLQTHRLEKHKYICLECDQDCGSDEAAKAHYDEKHSPDVLKPKRETREIISLPIDGKLSPEQAWVSVLGQLQMEMPRASFDTWVRDTQVIDFKDDLLCIGARNAYARDWLESRLTSTINRVLIGILDGNVKVQFVVERLEDE